MAQKARLGAHKGFLTSPFALSYRCEQTISHTSPRYNVWAGRQEGSEVGAKTIYLYESTNGSDFTKVATYNSSSYPGMLDSGWSYGDTPVEYTGVAGRYYYAVVKCYAGNSTGGDYRWYDTSTAH